ncbi:hypothetical protein SALWKB29_0939 [Snodgrassella communis]|uniref:Uncharacterized protein n=1 Tax=Snodgrassella communis TaxID=2946699 RepID=A0A836MRS2_9NEIS|nr:hypothetical protein SALWKB29_0939 [Snodgrassella communis]
MIIFKNYSYIHTIAISVYPANIIEVTTIPFQIQQNKTHPFQFHNIAISEK